MYYVQPSIIIYVLCSVQLCFLSERRCRERANHYNGNVTIVVLPNGQVKLIFLVLRVSATY